MQNGLENVARMGAIVAAAFGNQRYVNLLKYFLEWYCTTTRCRAS
jgi:hypothetical protein